ncbi:MAG: CDP-diacylglycerol--glycerol-3-phosphate 3-phosphatidyltransferase [Cellvibrionaceae bacterium]|nr:CDP-diacylglycerol--glycerol-3-phosphate 3-phosphatidyltransferase [Cellvibrionaceae bacterium]
MSTRDLVNFQSLSMVREELVATIDESARSLEAFVGTQDDGEQLQACVDGIKQIVGILKLIQFSGALMLSEELYSVATEISPGNSGRLFEKRLEIISNTFFVLTRYLEYVQQMERQVPVLLIPHINALRKLRSESVISESHFFHLKITRIPQAPAVPDMNIAGQPFVQVVRRMRQMYQVGLVSFIQERQLKNAVGLMRRALMRVRKISGPQRPLNSLWWLADVTLSAMNDCDMEPLETRKFVFSRIDRVFRQVEKGGTASFDAEPPKGLIKELVYLIALSGENSKDIQLIREQLGVEKFPYTDKELGLERDILYGPSVHTVMSLAKVLKAELGTSKKILEHAAQTSNQKIDDIDSFLGNLYKVSEILSVVGLVEPSRLLKKEIERVRGWAKLSHGPDNEELVEVANTLLYLESSISNLEKDKLSNHGGRDLSQSGRSEVVASGELVEAGQIVIEECEAGLALTKRALSAYAESNFDTNHILNIHKTLHSVRGGLLMLKKERAAGILANCAGFVEDVLMAKDHPAALQELLETFADAIIAIEYYLDSASANLNMDESVLQVAEDALEALGQEV